MTALYDHLETYYKRRNDKNSAKPILKGSEAGR